MAPAVPICRLLVAALACLTVATSIALTLADKQSGQTEKASQKQPPAARLRGSDLKRNQSNVSKIETVKLAQAKRAEAATKWTARKAKASSKAHTRRLMRSTDDQIAINASQLTAGSQANGFAASPDSWNNPHSLVPTFVDRQMGDEMVALASENEPSLELRVKALPQVNRSQLSSSAFMQWFNKDSGDNEKFQREVEQQMGGTAGARPPASRPAAALEDYYGDEEDEEDEQPAATSAKSAENRPFRGGYNHQQSAGFQLNELVNRSRTISRPGDSVELQRKQPDSWLPTDPIQTGNLQKANSDADESSILRRPQDDAKRIVGMFGGHETVGSPLTKTDIAIEYLKNILKTKQSHQQTGLRNSSNSTDLQDNSNVRKAANQPSAFYPLPIVMSDYANKKANTSEQAADPAGQPAEATRIQQASVASIGSAQHEAKFSIQDVKQQQQRLSPPQAGQAQYTLMPASLAPSSLAPFGAASESEHQQDRRFTSSPAPSTSTEQMIKSKPRGSVATSPISEVLNGTPLGGDYIESLDEFPRSAQQPVAQWSKVNEENQKALIGQGAKFGSDSLSASASEHLNSPHKANQHFYQQQASASFSQAPHQFEQLPPQSSPIQAHSSRYFHRQPLAQGQAQIAQQPTHQSSVQAIVAIGETNARLEAPSARVKGAESPLPEQPLRSPSEALFEPIGEQQRQLAAEASRVPSQLPQFSSANRTIANEPVLNKARVNPLGLEQIGEPVQLPPATKTTQISTAFEGPASKIVHEQQIEQQMGEPELGAPGKVYAKQEEAPEQMQHYRQLAQLPPALRELVHEQEQQMHQFQKQHLYRQEQAKRLHPTPHPSQALHLFQANQQQPSQQHHNEWQHQQQMQRYQVQLRQQYGELQPHYPQPDYQEQKHEARQQEAHQPHEEGAKIKPTHQNQASNYAAPATAPKSFEQPAIATEHRRSPVSLDIQKPPRIVSYNYFESGEPADESREAQKAAGVQATSFQFGDSLLSSNGDVEHMLTAAELEAIQRQFLTAEHPVVPLNDQQQPQAQHPQQQSVQAAHPQAGSEARQQLINSLRATGANISPELLNGQLSSPHGHGEESLRVLASNNQETRQQARDLLSASASEPAKSEPEARLREAKAAGEKKKSLIVYLNHPRSEEMSKVASSSEDSLAQLISEQTSGDPFVSAKEFDSHGLSKETKHLDVSRLRLEAAKEAQDKDGLSVVVIGDAYKYKKIVLLISSKSGGLKFIPMVKDMKR